MGEDDLGDIVGTDAGEISSIKVEQIAWQIGSEDPGAFRKIFRKLPGLSPGEYRRRFFVGEDAPETAAS